METHPSKINEQQKRYLSFLLHLHQVIPDDKFVSIIIGAEMEKFGIGLDALAILIQQKFIAVNKEDGKPTAYKWDTVRPTIHMANKIIEVEQERKKKNKHRVPKPMQSSKPVVAKKTAEQTSKRVVLGFETWIASVGSYENLGWLAKKLAKYVYKKLTA